MTHISHFVLHNLRRLRNWIVCRFLANDPEAVFNYIYEKNVWGDTDSLSGPGSNLFQTRIIRDEIRTIIRKYRITSILDIPCGDFYWMKEVNLQGCKYVGGDIVQSLIAQNARRYGGRNISFRKLNIISDALPKVDLIICRDCLVHFPIPEIATALANIRRSKSAYLLTTVFTKRKVNKNISMGGWRPINLMREPFHLPKPLLVINEQCDDIRYSDKSLALWRISDIPSY